jgi:hypothetical protein
MSAVSPADLIEIITPYGIVVFTETQYKEANEFMKQLPPIKVILDLHGVLSITDNTPFLIRVCGLSFVGPKMRDTAREDLGRRIESGQLAFAILVFKRGSRTKRSYELITEQGSKAAVVMFLQELNGKHCLFMDDSKDHIMSTKQLGGEAVYTTSSLMKDLTNKKTRERLAAFKVHAVEITSTDPTQLREWIGLWADHFA